MNTLRKARLLRLWTYFRRGHSTYLIFLLSFANFIVIQYNFLVKSIPFLSSVFPSLSLFVVLFATFYLPVSVLVGWMDYKKGAVPIDLALSNLANPWTKDLAKALMLICDGKKEEAQKILRKWT